MRTLLLDKEQQIIEAIRKGSLFIYPTDTVYGIGCNASIGKSVERLRKAKGATHPLSVIAPSRDWIVEHLAVRYPTFLTKLPGRFTFLLEKKNPDFLVECSPSRVLGVRIPDHPFSQLVAKAGVPFVTTSCNLSGEMTCTSLDRVPDKLKREIDFAIDGGVLRNPASQIWDLTGREPQRLR